jgi:cleavage and polyadenylation specificity factor subunit 2
MVDGRIAFSAGSTVPLVEDVHVRLPPREIKPDAESTVVPAQIEGAEQATSGEEVKDDIIVKTEPGTEVAVVGETASPALVAAPQPAAKGVLPGSLFVGDLRLANLKNRLSALTPPIAAEFAGEGVLICGPGIQKGQQAKGGSVVAVRKLGEGEIVMEGGLGRTYETVRRELYRGFARVVAG